MVGSNSVVSLFLLYASVFHLNYFHMTYINYSVPILCGPIFSLIGWCFLSLITLSLLQKINHLHLTQYCTGKIFSVSSLFNSKHLLFKWRLREDPMNYRKPTNAPGSSRSWHHSVTHLDSKS